MYSFYEFFVSITKNFFSVERELSLHFIHCNYFWFGNCLTNGILVWNEYRREAVVEIVVAETRATVLILKVCFLIVVIIFE